MNRNRALTVAAVVAAVAVAVSPSATADTGSPSYNQGKQAIDDAARQGPLHITDLTRYCTMLLGWEAKTGHITQVDSKQDFIAGCEDEGRVLAPPQ